jgi:hypothetical protein
MKLRALVVVPFVAVSLLLLALAIADPEHHRTIVRVEIETVKLFALVGCVTAALTFDRGEYLRRAWLLSGSCYFFLLVRDFGLGRWTPWAPHGPIGPVPVQWLESALVLAANAGAVAGTFMLARAWRVAGLEPTISATRRRVLFIGALLLALLTVGSNSISDARALARGDLDALVILASDAGDVVCLVLIAPVLLTAIALRGGALWWPWGLLTASMMSWLFYDALTSLSHVVAAASRVRVAAEVFRSLACMFAFSAGMAQRIVMRSFPARK